MSGMCSFSKSPQYRPYFLRKKFAKDQQLSIRGPWSPLSELTSGGLCQIPDLEFLDSAWTT